MKDGTGGVSSMGRSYVREEVEMWYFMVRDYGHIKHQHRSRR